jgi:hypothetical protein
MARSPDWSDAILRSALHLVDSGLRRYTGILHDSYKPPRPANGRHGSQYHCSENKSSMAGDTAWKKFSIFQRWETASPSIRQAQKLSESDMMFIKQTIINYQKYPNTAHEYAIEDLVTHLMPILGIERRPMNRVEFLKTLLKDYIVLTR